MRSGVSRNLRSMAALCKMPTEQLLAKGTDYYIKVWQSLMRERHQELINDQPTYRLFQMLPNSEGAVKKMPLGNQTGSIVQFGITQSLQAAIHDHTKSKHDENSNNNNKYHKKKHKKNKREQKSKNDDTFHDELKFFFEEIKKIVDEDLPFEIVKSSIEERIKEIISDLGRSPVEDPNKREASQSIMLMIKIYNVIMDEINKIHVPVLARASDSLELLVTNVASRIAEHAVRLLHPRLQLSEELENQDLHAIRELFKLKLKLLYADARILFEKYTSDVDMVMLLNGVESFLERPIKLVPRQVNRHISLNTDVVAIIQKLDKKSTKREIMYASEKIANLFQQQALKSVLINKDELVEFSNRSHVHESDDEVKNDGKNYSKD